MMTLFVILVHRICSFTLTSEDKKEHLDLERTCTSGGTRVKMCFKATTALIRCSIKDKLGFLGVTMHWFTALSTSTKRPRIS